MRVLVTGATGFLGQNLVRLLLASGETVRILARSQLNAEPLVNEGAELVMGDITDGRGLQVALKDIEVVFHLAGKLFIPGVPKEDYYHVHVEGTRRLLASSQEQGRLKRFIHISTTGVLGVTGDNPVDENAPCSPTNAYEDSKWKAELLVSDAIQKGFPAVIVRPGLVYGPGDLHLLGFFRTIQRRQFRPIGKKPVWLHPVFINDMSEALICCSNHPQAIGECFHIAGKDPATILELSSVIAIGLGKPLPAGTIPLEIAQLVAMLGDLLPAELKARAPLTKSRLEFLTHSRVYDVTKAERLLGYCARTDLPAGIEQTIAWYRQQGCL
jgi:nucleoside-diphosphate-sugar epimerase